MSYSQLFNLHSTSGRGLVVEQKVRIDSEDMMCFDGNLSYMSCQYSLMNDSMQIGTQTCFQMGLLNIQTDIAPFLSASFDARSKASIINMNNMSPDAAGQR